MAFGSLLTWLHCFNCSSFTLSHSEDVEGLVAIASPHLFYTLTNLISAEHRGPGIFGIPLRQSITYANVAISLVDENGESYIYGYVPIVVAKCGVFLKEKGMSALTFCLDRILDVSHGS